MNDERFLDFYRRASFWLAVWAGVWIGGALVVLTGAEVTLAGRLIAWAVVAGSVLSTALYGIDKFAAVRKNRRIPEATLHLTAILGGWPGAALAQQAFRHKTRKAPFLMRFLATATVHSMCCVVAYVLLGWFA